MTRKRSAVEHPFEEIKKGVERLVQTVPIKPMETEDGGKEWRFAPGEAEGEEVSRLLALWEEWETREKDSLLRRLPARTQEIVELLRIVRTKIALNKTNRHFMGYLREGAEPSAGRDFYVATFVRTIDHFQGIWDSASRQDGPDVPSSQSPEGR